MNVKGQGNKRQYLVKWEGYPLSESTWEPRSHFKISPELMMVSHLYIFITFVNCMSDYDSFVNFRV